MGSWIDHWWPALLAALGFVYAGFRSLRKVLRVADAILGYDDTNGHRVPGVAERVEAIDERVEQLEGQVNRLERQLAVALSAQGIDPESV